jgi:hypothetical protein
MVEEASDNAGGNPLGSAAPDSVDLELQEMPMLFMLWQRTLTRFGYSMPICWIHLEVTAKDGGDFQEIKAVKKATKLLLDEGFLLHKIDDIQLIRKALEWIFGKLVIESNQRAVRIAVASLNLN